ncbi:MAG: helix-turn-helix domain-containing protein [Saprospiraceae bacterium]|nr:helix-turn-helix domain-containing protein [Saprospiraceae bacterium]
MKSVPPYTPRQPTVTRDSGVRYLEVAPPAELADDIYCFWHLYTPQPVSDSFQYRIVADGCIDLIYDSLQHEGPFIMGFHHRYTQYDLGHRFHYCGVRFFPGAFPLCMQVNAESLADQFQELVAVHPDLAHQLKTPFEEIDSPDDDLRVVANAFSDWLEVRQKLSKDHRFFDALNMIYNQAGVVNLLEDIRTGLSPRQLRRVFHYYVGASPKAFCQVVRFQSILAAKPSSNSLRNNRLFYGEGYYDQAHFIKEFKRFYGVSPGVAFGRHK